MIDVRELRKNCLVMDRGGKVLRIDWMERDKVCQKMELHGQEVHPLTEHFEYLQPIPLTEEWLVKFSFDKHTQGYTEFPTFYNKKGVLAIKDEGVNGINLYRVQKVFAKGKWRGEENHFYVSEIQYVHELMNLVLDLTGTELKMGD